MINNSASLFVALNDFRKARRKAKLQSLLTSISGRSGELLSFQEVKQQIKLSGLHRSYQTNIPLDAIVGSVGRYQDFDEKFLPLKDSNAQRWAKVKQAQEKIGLPPIEVYKISEVYFVLDGHHRVSVARQMRMQTIDANVQEFKSNITITPDDKIEDVILKAEKKEFFGDTNLDHEYPDYDLEPTLPGRYRELFEHIRVHQYYLGLEKHKDIQLKVAVNSWMKKVYIPAIHAIRASGILRDFPGRTETDLYLWLKKYQAELSKALDWKVDVNQAAKHLAEQSISTTERIAKDFDSKSLDIYMPNENYEIRPPSEWRIQINGRQNETLFNAILIGLSGTELDRCVIDQAVLIAHLEGASLRGLHVVQNEKERTSAKVKNIRDNFHTRCVEKEINGEFAVEVGKVAERIVQRAIWVDLVMLHLSHPPGPLPLDRLKSGFTTILHYCPRPVWVVPSVTTPLNVALLAYDGSPKSKEALFLSSYLGKKWKTKLVVVNVAEGKKSKRKNLIIAKEYLEKQAIKAEYIWAEGAAGDTILETAETYHANLIVMGGYGTNQHVYNAIGSTVDHILRLFNFPVMICQ